MKSKTGAIDSVSQGGQSIASFLSQFATTSTQSHSFQSHLSEFEGTQLDANSPLHRMANLIFLKNAPRDATACMPETNDFASGIAIPQGLIPEHSNQPQSLSQLLSTKSLSSQVDSTKKFQDIVQEASQKYHVPVALINAVIQQESAFNPQATSHCGAMGLMQLMPKTAAGYGCQDAYDPRQNIMAGTQFLGDLLTKYKGDVTLATAAYNAGPGNVAKYGNQVPPFKETQNYVQRVQKFFTQNLSKSNSAQALA